MKTIHIAAIAALLLAGTAEAKPGWAPNPTDQFIFFGPGESVGNGTVRTFFETEADGFTPLRLGVVFDRQVLEGLPAHANPDDRCFDVDGDGSFGMYECLGGYEWPLAYPAEALRSDMPFTWFGLNWNPHGHAHPGAPPQWARPHFDFHFYIQPYADVQAIRPGPCAELIDCDDFVTATTPVPPQFMPAHHANVGAAVPAMGNHLIDTLSPELVDPSVPFTYTWIYGAYDGHITFYEPMITHAFLKSRQNVCVDIHLPAAWEQSGWYPTSYCVEWNGAWQRVTLENFVYRVAPAGQ